MSKILVILLVILLIFTSGCVNKYVSFRDTCDECDTNLNNWQECIYKCENLSNHKSDYNVPIDWELSYVSKEKFTLNKLNGDKETTINYNCICKFQKLTPAQHEQMKYILQSNRPTPAYN